MATMTIGIGFNFEERRPLQGRLADHDALSHNGETMALPATVPERSSNGLSVLQRRLLVMATINRLTRSQERRTPDSCADLYLEQVLAEVYDLPELDGEAISQRRYAAAAAAFSRCLHRLERRGLVRYIRGGHNRPAACLLTPEGERLCHAMVNKRQTVMQER